MNQNIFVKNKWIMQDWQGSTLALGFQGDDKFIETSLNFVYNMGVAGTKTKPRRVDGVAFAYIFTTTEKLKRGLKLEGYMRGWERTKQSGLSEKQREKEAESYSEKYMEEEFSRIEREEFLREQTASLEEKVLICQKLG
jgi:hypothetical protein